MKDMEGAINVLQSYAEQGYFVELRFNPTLLSRYRWECSLWHDSKPRSRGIGDTPAEAVQDAVQGVETRLGWFRSHSVEGAR